MPVKIRMMGTTNDILPKKERTTERTKKVGRPRVNRDLALRLFKAKVGGQPTYSPSQIARMVECNVDTVYIMRKEFVESGQLEPENERRETAIIEGDFDKECQRATGMSFLLWVKDKQPGQHRYIYNFVERVWISVWNRPSLVNMKDMDSPEAGQRALEFKTYFGEDENRMRARLKLIRTLFRFLGRMDICDRDLTMSESRHPREIRRIPIIEMRDFPIKLQRCIDELSESDKSLIMFKLVAQGRSGDPDKERGVFGMRKLEGKSYCIMDDENSFKIHLFEKMKEEWDISYVPPEVRKRLFEIYKTVEDGDFIFKDYKEVIKRWRAVTKKILGQELILHDLRKISITWFYALGVPLEIATMLNVGWKDLGTPQKHYLHMRSLLRKDDKRAYRANIPAWFKDGIEEYTEDTDKVNSIIQNVGGRF